MQEKIIQELKKLLPKTNIYLTKRGNESIKLALQQAKKQNKTKIHILDQGGWITYPQFIKKLKLTEIRIKTDNCKLDLDQLKNTLDKNSTLLIHSLSGYFYKQPMKEIEQICKKKETLLITDVAGAILDKELIKGNIIIGSFGRWKPINNHSGGFIASNENLKLTHSENIETPKKLLTKIKEVKQRSEFLNNKSKELIKEIKKQNLETLNNEKNNSDLNYVVIAPFNTEEEKEQLIQIAKKHNLEYNKCPREIRTLTKAISIEVKKM